MADLANDNNNDNDDNDRNRAGRVLMTTLNTLFLTQNKLLENNNPVKFKYPFNGRNVETLQWIFAAEKYLKINDFTSEKIKFQRIFSSMNENYQNRYLIETEANDDNYTFKSLKEWVLKEYPPPKTKYEFRQTLQSMLMYKNEDPNIAYSRFKYKLSLITRAISTINEGLKAQSEALYPGGLPLDKRKVKEHYDSTKMFNVSVEDRIDALKRMFVLRNNKSTWNNDGKINELVVKRIARDDPTTLDKWDECLKSMKRDLISRVYDGIKEYEFISYPIDDNVDDIYSKRHHMTPTNAHHQSTTRITKTRKRDSGRKRGRDAIPDKNGPKSKKPKTGICNRCRRPGHYAKDCYADRDAKGNAIKSPAPKQSPFKSTQRKCRICGGTNHNAHNCYHKDKFKSTKCNNCGKYGHIERACLRPRKDNQPPKTKNGFSTYPSRNKYQNQDQPMQPEVNAMAKTDNLSLIETIKQWTDNNSNMNDTVRNDFHQFINQLTSNPRQ